MDQSLAPQRQDGRHLRDRVDKRPALVGHIDQAIRHGADHSQRHQRGHRVGGLGGADATTGLHRHVQRTGDRRNDVAVAGLTGARGVEVDDIGTTAKTLPGFAARWRALVSGAATP